MRRLMLLSLLFASPVAAQETMTKGEVEAIRERARAHASEAEAFAATIRQRAEALRGEAEALRQSARANRVAAPASAGAPVEGLDLDRLVAASEQLQRASEEVGPQLLAFVSFSMPEAALRQIVQDVTAVGGAVVFRGMPQNSIKAFRNRLLGALGANKAPANIGIDPRLFRAFGVIEAPTFVVVSTGFELCDGFDCQDTPPPYDRMTGNVSVAYVLETVAAGRGPGAAVAKVLAQRLKQPARSGGAEP
ncbi:MAG TPA: type-F conjugative transfer system pilin assembly protein TrbC [Pedomonas sp.]|uniref:type-F conjugative transfer system pilin assembly protein TrbC n=1 Tax=Pedomonas sp. TaxID=2976421 RepID=UPI002F3FA38F